MKIIVLGSGGFIGRNVAEALEKDHEVIGVDRSEKEGAVAVNLLNKQEVENLLSKEKPDAVINCAGTVENTEVAFSINPVITYNVLSCIKDLGLKTKYYICGSAGEYGVVDSLPVSEQAPLRGEINYAKSKVIEEAVAVYFREQGLSVTVFRIFNPIGPGMHPRFLIPSLIRQLGEIKQGGKDSIELSRLDAKRDYIDVRDIARAIKAVVEKGTAPVYNIGSGKATSNKELVELIAQEKGEEPPLLKESSAEAEPQYATMADIKKITTDTGWTPEIKLQKTVQEIIKETDHKE